MANLKELEKGWDIIKRNEKEYVRFRKTYGNERKEFIGKDVESVKKKIRIYEGNPMTRTQKEYRKMPFYMYMEECNDFFKSYKREQNNNAHSRRSLYIKHVMATPLGKAQLQCVTTPLILDFLSIMVDKELARATINKDFFFIKRCLQRALDDGIIENNPASNVAPLDESEVKKSTKVVKPFQVEDMKRLLNEAKRVNTKDSCIHGAIGERVYGVNADVIIFQLFTGLRIGEALGLRWKNVDFENESICVAEAMKDMVDENGKRVRRLGTPKTKESVRDVYLCEEAKEILLEQKRNHPNAKEDDLVFVNELGNTIDRMKVNRTLKAMASRCDCSIQDVGSHALRHTFGSYLISEGVDIYIVSKIMGHKSIKTTETVYAKLLNKQNKEVMKVFANLKKE